jgi:ABC-type polysaccharide/polyol phosphate transport system ATPase subunit
MTKPSDIAIDVQGVSKTFRIPLDPPATFKERAVHPFRKNEERELKVLDDISFSVKRGEFFGVVGRNGSGKSTLLKLLASVYRADSGVIKVAGLVAPVVELGVGFQPELSARENVLINGLMMGLTAKEARNRFDAVIEFAELQDFVDLKLKNYSSGMRARLAFAIVMQTDPDVLLLDEVLAVGDPPFQRRCQEAFNEIKRNGTKTVVLVTHSMAYVERYCDRAMMLDLGKIGAVGDPKDVGRQYSGMAPAAQAGAGIPTRGKAPARITSIRVLDSAGFRTTESEPDGPIRLHITAEADEELDSPRLLVRIGNGLGVGVFESAPIDLADYVDALAAGETVGVGAKIENRLLPGQYYASCVVATGPTGAGTLFSDPAAARFVVGADGSKQSGLVSLDYSVRLRTEPAAGEAR